MACVRAYADDAYAEWLDAFSDSATDIAESTNCDRVAEECRAHCVNLRARPSLIAICRIGAQDAAAHSEQHPDCAFRHDASVKTSIPVRDASRPFDREVVLPRRWCRD